MRVLVIGSKGRQGKRFSAILRYLKEDVVEADIGDKWWGWRFDRAIVATPTQSHFGDLAMLIDSGKPVLCEKPITKSLKQLDRLIEACPDCPIRMVSNWLYALNSVLARANGNRGVIANLGEMILEYWSHHSGEDGLFWDCVQPIYMAGVFRWNRNVPFWGASVDGYPIFLDDIEESYPAMVSDWLYSDTNRLWTLEDARKAALKVEWALAHHKETESGEINFQEVGVTT